MYMKNIQISDGLHRQLKKYCAEQGLLMRFYVERLIINELDEVLLDVIDFEIKQLHVC